MNARRIASLAALLALVATVANAGPTPTRGWQKTIELQPAASAGVDDVVAEGLAIVGKKNGVEYFGVRVFAKMPDGAKFVVRGEDVNGFGFMIGTMEMFLGSASLYLESAKVPSDVFPVGELRRVSVVYGAQEVLFGTF